MNKLDIIIAVADVEKSSVWYQSLLPCRSMHGGDTFDILVDSDEEVLLCLHKLGEHDHPTMMAAGNGVGNGLILYFRVDELEVVRENARKLDCLMENEIAINHNSGKREFALRDLDGYYLIVSEYHEYKG